MARRADNRGSTERRRRRKPAADFDSPWKEILDRYFELAILFFFRVIHADIDWSRGYEMLDKELQKIIRHAKHGRRTVDKLVKVWLKNGEETWLLIHIELQTWRETGFSKRMFNNNYRILDRYDREVISLAILADDDPNWRPNQFGYGRWGFTMHMEYPAPKLLDYSQRWQELETNSNPFAMVVLAHLKTLETRQALEERKTWKIRLVKGLYERGLRTEDIRELMRFIEWVMQLTPAMEKLYEEEIEHYQEEKRMPYILSFERRGMEKGLLRGIELGIKLKFGAPGLELMPEIRELEDYQMLNSIFEAIETASSPEDLRRIWAPKRRSRKSQGK